MTDMTYDAYADAVYIAIGPGRIERTKKTGLFVYDYDADGHIVGIEIRSATKILAPGDWQKARRPKKSARQHVPTVDRHRGFIFIKRLSPRDVESR